MSDEHIRMLESELGIDGQRTPHERLTDAADQMDRAAAAGDGLPLSAFLSATADMLRVVAAQSVSQGLSAQEKDVLDHALRVSDTVLGASYEQ